VSGSSWQARTAVAILIGAGGEGGCVLLARYVGGGFLLVTLVVAVALGWRFGPWVGGTGAGTPPLGLVFASSGHEHVGEAVFAALAVVLLLGGCAWMTGRVRERYGKPPWGPSTDVSE
jgi:hypothetical protein